MKDDYDYGDQLPGYMVRGEHTGRPAPDAPELFDYKILKEHFKYIMPSPGELAGFAQERFSRWYRENIASAPVVYGLNGCKGWSTNKDGDTILPWQLTARLVMIQPVVRDTAEGLLREEVERMNKLMADGWDLQETSAIKWYERAKALLAERGK